MLFNTYVFIFAFWPITAAGYFLLNRFRFTFAAKCWLTLSSLFFYSWWNVGYLPLILGSIAFNYAFGRLLQASGATANRYRKTFLIAAIGGNLLLLGYYKYADFFLGNLSSWTGHAFPALHLLLPLGISFFTFTQIAFLVDAYKGKASEPSLDNYVLFVTFFPHLLAGPIIHHSEMMPQFAPAPQQGFAVGQRRNGVFSVSSACSRKSSSPIRSAAAANAGSTSATHRSRRGMASRSPIRCSSISTSAATRTWRSAPR